MGQASTQTHEHTHMDTNKMLVKTTKNTLKKSKQHLGHLPLRPRGVAMFHF